MTGRAPKLSAPGRAIALPPIATWAVFGGIALIALLFGYVASRADAVLIAVTVAGVAGIALLARPVWMIWATLVLGLLVVGVVPLWADEAAAKAVWGVSILGFALFLAALLRVATDHRVVTNTPSFVWLALIFIVYTSLNSLLQLTTPMQSIGAFRRYFSMYGLIFCLAWLPIGEELMARWRRFLLIAALVQLPWAVFELFKFVPIREGLAYALPGMVPIDVVAGTFGASLRGGGSSGEMAIFLIFALGFLLARLREGSMTSRELLWMAPLLVLPLFIGETKIILIVFPIFFITLYRRWLKRNPAKGLVLLMVGALLTVALAIVYISESRQTPDRWLRDVTRYNFGSRGYGDYKLNRTTVLTFWLEKQSLRDPISAVFGNGLGAASDSTIPPGSVARRYARMGVGLTSASTLLWDTGIVGSILFTSVLLGAWRAAGKLVRGASEPWVRADAAAIQATLPVFLSCLFYRSSLLDQIPFQIVFTFCIGYLAWLCRHKQASLTSNSRSIQA